jgi:hypothetical protein
MAAEERSLAAKTRRFELRLSDDDRERFQAMADSAGITLLELWRKLGDDGLKKAAYRGG